MAKYKMPFNQYKSCQRMSQKEFSIWLEAIAKESWQQGYAQALEQVPDGSIVIDPNNAMVVEMEDNMFREVLLSVPGVGPKLCDKIIERIYQAFDNCTQGGETE